MNSIELTNQRLIAITDRGRQYRFGIPTVTEKQWRQYFSEIVSTSEQKGKELINEFDSSRARVNLFDAVVETADGYSIEAGKTVAELPDWKKKIPLPHKLAVANVLFNVQVVTADDGDAIALGVEEVTLQALWGCDDKGNMVRYSKLVHRFDTPSAEHQMRYSRALSRSKVVGGSRRGKTYWSGAQAELIEIYDELIVGVDGYTFKSCNLSDREIARNMDAYHKVVAAEQLFRAAGPDVEEE